MPFLNTEGMFGATFCEKDGHANPFHCTMAYAQGAARVEGTVEAHNHTPQQRGHRLRNQRLVAFGNDGDVLSHQLRQPRGPDIVDIRTFSQERYQKGVFLLEPSVV